MIRGCFFISAVLLSSLSMATPLGKNINDAAQVKVQATSSSATLVVKAKTSSLGASYSVRETTDEIRTMKEFVDAQGVVFAVAWEGVGSPDFSQIFGSYYNEFERERKAQFLKGRSRNRMAVNASGIVVSNSGHGSFMKGLAYAPSLLPPGVAAEDLK